MSRDFQKLLVVCLKMFFRKSTRKRFVCLVGVFIFIMGFNTTGYVRKFHETEARKASVMSEQAFKVFFLRCRTANDLWRLVGKLRNIKTGVDADVVAGAFIYQNNLFLHFPIPEEFADSAEDDNLRMLSGLFNADSARRGFVSDELADDPHRVVIGNVYVDHNGARLTKDRNAERRRQLAADLLDVSDMFRRNLPGSRFRQYNDMTREVISGLHGIGPDGGLFPNAYLSRVECVVPMNILHLWANLGSDRTTDIVDYGESVKPLEEGRLNVGKELLLKPKRYSRMTMYDETDIYPRYIPVRVSRLLTVRREWTLLQDIRLDRPFMDEIENLHFGGNFLFSFEKSKVIRDVVATLNRDIRFNHWQFYLTDLSMGIAFPFIISLFAFIHLKSEFAFLLMFRNKVRQLLAVFWLLPVGLMLLLKAGIAGGYLLILAVWGCELPWGHMVLPMAVVFMAAAGIFYPVNRWCFSQFIGNDLNLYALHKGR